MFILLVFVTFLAIALTAYLNRAQKREKIRDEIEDLLDCIHIRWNDEDKG
ncbi:MAG: hypothetical protein ACE5SW_05450 [Nitrososphaeraceae archaeon]